MGNKFAIAHGIYYLFLTIVGTLAQYTFPGGGHHEQTVDPYFRRNFPYWVDGMSKDGRAVYTIPFGKWDIAGKVSSKGKSNEFRDFLVSNLEEVKRAIKKTTEMHPGKAEVNKAISIVDWDGFDWSQLLNFQAAYDISEFVRIYEKQFQGTFDKVFYINCEDSISKFTDILKKILPDAMKLLTLRNKDKEVWQKEILQYIDADQIRPAFGGTKDDDKNPFV